MLLIKDLINIEVCAQIVIILQTIITLKNLQYFLHLELRILLVKHPCKALWYLFIFILI